MSKEIKKIKALITLLGDDDENIRALVRRKLLELGSSANEILKETAFSDSEGRIRIEAQAILEEIRLEKLTQDFRDLNRGSDFDLENASFILAQIEYPNLNVSEYIKKIDALAVEAEEKIFGINTERKRVELINDFLFNEKGFRGNAKAYYEPENSYINKVLDRHLGIPISLSALYLFLAKRLNLPVHGVGFPGHFLLKYNVDSDLFFIDAFNQGQILSRRDCEVFLNKMGYPLYDIYLSPSEPRDILARMIRNLVLIYSQNNQPRKIDTLERIFSDFVMK